MPNDQTSRPLIVLVVPRGEAVRNFIYSDTLRLLSEQARVVVMSVVTHEAVLARARPFADEIIAIQEHPVRPLARYARALVEHAHDRWLWSQVAQNNWELRARRARQAGGLHRLQWTALSSAARLLANPPCLRHLTRLERSLQWRLRTTRRYDELLGRLKPDLLFNGSHIHGPAGELPVRVAHRLGIRTAGFIFSWDNLTSRSRILAPYDHWLVWNEGMKQQLLGIYPQIPADRVFVTGTPQMDFHFRPELILSREELCRRMGLDPARPFVLYTTGIDRHFPNEHLHVERVIRLLRELELPDRPQLVVRNYIKGTSPEMKRLAGRRMADVVFPPMRWDAEWSTPLPEDVELYYSLVRHAAVGINAASTVTLEFMLLDKPVINLDFDPEGTRPSYCDGFRRHIRFDHFQPVARSGGSMVAQSAADLRRMLLTGLTDPEAGSGARRQFVRDFFGFTADGHSGRRVAETLVELANRNRRGRQFEPNGQEHRSARTGIRPRLLVISHVRPFPGSSGQQQRVRHILQTARKQFEVDFLTVAPRASREETHAQLEAMGCRGIVLDSRWENGWGGRWLRRAGAGLFVLRTGLKPSNYAIGRVELSPERIGQAVDPGDYDLALYEYFHAAASVAMFGRAGVPAALDTHNVLWKSFEERPPVRRMLPGRVRRWWLGRYRQQEERAWRRFDGVIAINRREQELLRECLGPGSRLFYAPMGVDLERWPYGWQPVRPLRLAYYGALGNAHNQAAALRCHDRIMPVIWKRFPDAELWLVGSNPPQPLRHLTADPRVKVTGFVQRPQDTLGAMSLALCPWSGTYGFRSRVVELMALGVPVIATPQAVDGMELESGRGILLAESEERMARQAVSLLTDAVRLEEQSRAARAETERLYSLDKTYGRLMMEMRDWVEAREGRRVFKSEIRTPKSETNRNTEWRKAKNG